MADEKKVVWWKRLLKYAAEIALAYAEAKAGK